MKKPIFAAIIITILIVLWVLSGQFGGQPSDAGQDDKAAKNDQEELFTVKASQLAAQSYIKQITVRGRTEALRTVELKAETEGRVSATPLEKGQRIKEGALICQLEPNDKEASLAEARALVQQRQLEYDAAVELAAKGHRSETQAAGSKALLDAALAQARRAEVELARTSIRAPFDGLIEDRPAEVGDLLLKGNVCAKMVFEDPFLVIGEVSENEVSFIEPGQPATAKLVDGKVLNGKIRFVATTARPETRTFRVEIEVPNPEHTLRDGITAEIKIPLSNIFAHFIPSSAMVLDDDGRVGIRAVENGHVRFFPIEIIGDDFNGLWVSGLPSRFSLITVGQDFVSEGQEVAVSLEENAGGQS